MKKFILPALLLVLATACANPIRGSGALYIANRGNIECTHVDNVTFMSSRYTQYVVNGDMRSTEAALDFHAGEYCK